MRTISAAAITLALGLAGFQTITGAYAQGAQTPGSGTSGQGEATGSCTITSRGNQRKTCTDRVPQASCAANAREQRTTFAWQAGVECP